MYDSTIEQVRQEKALLTAASRLQEGIATLIEEIQIVGSPLHDEKVAELSKLVTKLIF